MRIALYDNLTSGGSKREAFEFAKAFQANGHTVDLWTTTAADASFLPMHDVTTQHHIATWPTPFTPPRRLPGLRRHVSAAADIRHMREVAVISKRMAHDIDRLSYDFVFLHHCHPVQGPYLARYLRTRSLYYCAEPLRAAYEPGIPRPYQQPAGIVDRLQQCWYQPSATLVAAARKRADWINVRSATALVTNSCFTAESLYRAYNRRAYVVHSGVDPILFRPLGIPRQNFFVSVGAVAPLKGYDFLIEALGCLPDSRRLPLVIVGNTVSSGEQAWLEKLAAQHKVTLDIRCNVSDQNLVMLYNQARAMLYASILEPMGFAPLEAMACGTPVVAVAEGGVRETVRDGVSGLLTQRHPGAFASAVERILNDTDLARHLEVSGREWILGYWTWPHAFDRLLAGARMGLGI